MNLQGIYFFEDDQGGALTPVTSWNDPWDLLLGAFTLKELATRLWPSIPVQGIRKSEKAQLTPGRYLFLNSRLLSLKELLQLGEQEGSLSVRSETAVGALVTTLDSPWEGDLSAFVEEVASTSQLQQIVPQLGSYYWEFVRVNRNRLESDADLYELGKHEGVIHERATLLNPEHISIAKECEVGPGAVLDARNGRILLETGAVVGANAVIVGPVYIGSHTIVHPQSYIRPETSLGAHCRIGGEVGKSIILANSDKQHHGYLGRSYVGSWCNIGAGCTTSTLKNTHGEIAVELGAQRLPTGLEALGSFIGDHVKTGTNMSLEPGTVVGAFSNVFGQGSVPKTIASFTWLDAAQGGQTFQIEKAREVADRFMRGRGSSVSDAQWSRMEALFRLTHGHV